jgi:hypothetical protein
MPRPVLHRVAGSPSRANSGGSSALLSDAETTQPSRAIGTDGTDGPYDAPPGSVEATHDDPMRISLLNASNLVS